MSKRTRVGAVAAIALASAGCATIPQASGGLPDYSASPTYRTVNLTAGFEPDPLEVRLLSGGDLDARNISSSCAGFIAHAPDVRLHYNAGEFPLILSVDSSADTTLVVNGPDGRWYCDDDGGVEGANPALRFNLPGSGQYDIWVGTYGGTQTQSARLLISEVSSW